MTLKFFISQSRFLLISVLYMGVQSVADGVRRGRLRWFGHLERRSVDDWVSGCRKVEVAGASFNGRNRKTWKECADKDIEVLGLHCEWAVFRDVWRPGGTSYGQTYTPSIAWKYWMFSK